MGAAEPAHEGSIRIFVGSPSEMEADRRAIEQAIDQLNFEEHFAERLVYLDWKKSAAPGAGRPQEVILKDIGDFDIFVGLFGGRIGSPTGRAAGGTVEEYDEAYARRQDDERPEILVYFKRPEKFPTLDELEDLRAVVDFKARADAGGLTGEYGTPEDLVDNARRDLAAAIRRRGSREAAKSAQAANYGDDPVEKKYDEPEEIPSERADERIDPVDVRLLLEAKLAWVNKHMLAGPHTPTYATIGSLEYDRFLPRDEARRLSRLLALDPDSTEDRDPANLALFLQAVQKDVRNFRATVFNGLVRRQLEEAGWTVQDFEQPSGYRPHFLATKDGTTLRIAARLATARKSTLLNREIERLASTRDDDKPVTRRVVVIPDISNSPTTNDDPEVVKLGDLLKEGSGPRADLRP